MRGDLERHLSLFEHSGEYTLMRPARSVADLAELTRRLAG
jgi:hypothetical protein